MKKNIATTLGFLTAPLITAIAFVALAMTSGVHDLFDVLTLVWGAIFYFYALAVSLIIGLPAYLILRRFDKVTWWSAVLVGMFSAVIFVIFGYMDRVVILVGGLSGLVFWLIWKQGHKEKPSDHSTLKEQA